MMVIERVRKRERKKYGGNLFSVFEIFLILRTLIAGGPNEPNSLTSITFITIIVIKRNNYLLETMLTFEKCIHSIWIKSNIFSAFS